MKTKSSAKFTPTARDLDIVRLVYKCSWLNTAHITKLLFPYEGDKDRMYQTTSAQATRRLKFLYENKVLGRVIPLMEVGKGRDPYIYYCEKKAYEGVLEGLALIPKINAWDSKYRHDKLVRDYATDILVSAQSWEYEVIEHKSTRELKGEYAGYWPDWFISMKVDEGSPLNYYLEVDNGQESQTQWKAKIQAIVKYWNSDEYKAIYGTSRLRIVTITTTEARMESLIQWTREEKGGSRFWFTTFDKVTTEDVTFDQIWRVCNQEGLYRMTATKK